MGTAAYKAIELPLGDSWQTDPALADLPAATLEAARQAKGVLVRTLFTAKAGAECTAACLGYHRPHTSQMKLCALAGAEELYKGLFDFAAQEVMAQGLVLKTELGALAPSPLADAETRARSLHYRQTTNFTCGSVATLDALRRLGLRGALNRTDEIALWREATMVVACGPYGLALAAARRGCMPTVYVSRPGCVLDTGKKSFGLLDAQLSRDIQLNFEAQAHEQGVPIVVGPFGTADIAQALDAGHIVIVLIDEVHWHGESCPHWVTVVRHEGQRFFVDDPWCDLEFGESAVDAYELAVDAADLELVSSYDGVRAMLVF